MTPLIPLSLNDSPAPACALSLLLSSPSHAERRLQSSSTKATTTSSLLFSTTVQDKIHFLSCLLPRWLILRSEPRRYFSPQATNQRAVLFSCLHQSKSTCREYKSDQINLVKEYKQFQRNKSFFTRSTTTTTATTREGNPSVGGSSEGFLAHENTTSYWRKEHDVSLPGVLGYGYEYSSWIQPFPLYYEANPYNMSNTSIHANNGTIPCSISGTSLSGTVPSNILGTSTRVSRAAVNPESSSQLSDSVLGKNSGLTFSSKLPHENAGVLDNIFNCESGKVLFESGTVPPVPRSSHNQIPCYQSDMKSKETPCVMGIVVGRVQPYSHKGIHSDICKEEITEVGNDRKGEMEAKAVQRPRLEFFESMRKQALSMERNAVQHSSSCCSPASAACVPSDTVEAIGSSSLAAKGASLNVILEELQYLSDMLSSDFDASELEDHDCELLQLVIDNLGAFTIKDRKNASARILDDFSRYPEDAHSSTSGLKSDFVINLNSGSHDTEEEVHSFALDTSNDKLNFADNHNSPNLNNDKNVAQAVDKIFPDYFSNNEEISQAKVYKKLWIDAEAALCSLKYELQLAQIKLKADNHNHQSKGELQQSSEVSSLNSIHEALVISKENN